MRDNYPYDEKMKLLQTRILIDSTSALSIAKREQVLGLKKHIEVKIHSVKNAIEPGMVEITHLSRVKQPADMLTKPVDGSTLNGSLPLILM